MAATDTGQTRVVPLQNVAYDMSQQINYLLTVKSPPKTELKKPQRLYAHVAESLCFNVILFFLPEKIKGSIAEGDTGTPSLADINRSSRDTNALQLWASRMDPAWREERGEEGEGK